MASMPLSAPSGIEHIYFLRWCIPWPKLHSFHHRISLELHSILHLVMNIVQKKTGSHKIHGLGLTCLSDLHTFSPSQTFNHVCSSYYWRPSMEKRSVAVSNFGPLYSRRAIISSLSNSLHNCFPTSFSLVRYTASFYSSLSLAKPTTNKLYCFISWRHILRWISCTLSRNLRRQNCQGHCYHVTGKRKQVVLILIPHHFTKFR